MQLLQPLDRNQRTLLVLIEAKFEKDCGPSMLPYAALVLLRSWIQGDSKKCTNDTVLILQKSEKLSEIS